MQAQTAAKRILSYTAKKRAFVATVAVALGIVALCLVNVNAAITLIALPVIIAAAFVVDKILIIVRPDVYGKDMLVRGRTPVIATTTVVAAFTAICLVSGIVGYQLAMYTAANANVVESFATVDEAVDFLQKSGLEDKYSVTVQLDISNKSEFKSTAVFTPKNGEVDANDFSGYKDVVIEDGKAEVEIRCYRMTYAGEEYVYYVANLQHLNAKIEAGETGINVVDYGRAIGLVLGAAFGAAAQIALLAVVYVVGIIAAIVPSEIYFEKLIRNEAKAVAKKEESGNGTEEDAEETV